MTYNGLPLIYLDILDDMTGIDIVSLVDRPAVERNFIAFEEQRDVKFAVNDEKRIVTGPALIPGQKIYRRDDDGKEYYVTFTAEAIERIAVKFFADHNSTNVNLQHEFDVDGCVYFESYLINKERNIYPTEFGELPNGTWMLSAKILNDDVWKLIQDNVLRGFSIEGHLNAFEKKPVLNSINDLMNYINNK